MITKYPALYIYFFSMIAVLPLAILSMLRFGFFLSCLNDKKRKENQLKYHLSLEYIADQGLLSS